MTTKKKQSGKQNKPVGKKAKRSDVPKYTTAEAWDWLNSWVWAPRKKHEDDPEPEAYPPLWYVGPEILSRYSDALGHPLTLKEVQYLVHLDGEGKVTCHFTKKRFIPVSYPSEYIPDEVLERLRNGTSLEEAGIYTRGQFNILRGTIYSLSGSIYHEVQLPSGEKEFDYAYNSTIVSLATKLMFKRRKNYPIWTCVSREGMQKRKAKRAKRQELSDAVWDFAGEMDADFRQRRHKHSSNGNGLLSVETAVKAAKPLKKKKTKKPAQTEGEE